MSMRLVLGILFGIAASIATVGLVGRSLWQSRSRDLCNELAASDENVGRSVFRASQMEDLPDPVKRYFSAVLTEGQAMVASARIEHRGTFNMGIEASQWRRFSSVQHVVVFPPGFVWNANIQMAPGLSARVHDAYVAGRGVLTARLFGLIPVMEQPDSPELAQGELMRFLAEAPWYPTAWLPGQAVSWEPIDASQARVTLTDGETSVSLDVRFNDEGLVDSVFSDGRYRDVNGIQVATPWEGRFWNYQDRGGMRIPMDGEVAWLLPEGRRAYWRGHIERIDYRFVP